MSSIITYETELPWLKFHRPTPEIFKKLIMELDAFRPSVPIEDTHSIFIFSINDDRTSIKIKTEIDAATIVGKDEIDEDFPYSILDNIVLCRLKDLFFSINLAYPGCIHITRSVVFRNREPLHDMFSYGADISAWAHNEYAKWLPFENLTIQQCWEWIATKTNFLLDISRTSIDRALHALSYECSATDDMSIFYVLLGLEAIYNNNSNREDSILEQLRRKSQALLGELPPNAIKAIRDMYSKRSKLVHGSANIFKYWQMESYEEKEYDKVMDERKYVVIATGLLLATIQKFIKANANTLTETIAVKLE